MKNVVINILIIFSSIVCFSQNYNEKNNFVGIWQADTTIEGSAWLDNYQFFANGNFIFNFNEYDSNKRLDCLKGKYRLSKDTMYLIVENIVEVTDGKLTRGATSWEDEWLLKNIKTHEIKNTDLTEYKVQLSSCNYKSLMPCIVFDNRKYFKLKNDPNDY